VNGDAFPDGWYCEVFLDWSRPVEVSYNFDGLTELADNWYGLYRFERGHALKDGPRDIVRIGIAFDQTLGARIRQYTPKLEEYRRRGSLWVSWAALDLFEGQHRRRRYEDVEHLMIFAVQPDYNERKRNSVPDDFYRIENSGYRGGLPRDIVFPLLRAQ
jgi:hypothetical protein